MGALKPGNMTPPAYDGNPRRDKPCERCGWRWEGFHVCFDRSVKVEGEGVPKPVSVARHRNGNTKERSDAAREMASEAAKLRWERYHESMRPRDSKIEEMYRQGYSYSQMRERFNMSADALLQVVKRAAARGELELR